MSRALILRSTLVLLFAGIITAMVLRLTHLPVYTTGIFPAFATMFAAEPLEPTPAELEVLMRRLHLAPEHLAAAGLNATQASEFVGNMHESLVAAAPGLRAADQAVGSARAEVDSLSRLVRSGQANEGEVSALAAARTQLSQAESERDSILNNLHALTSQFLSTAQAQALATMRDNSTWTLPIEYSVVSRSQSQWVVLRKALAHIRIAAALDEDPDDEVVTLVNQANSDQAVALARASLDTNLAAVTVAWHDALDGPGGD